MAICVFDVYEVKNANTLLSSQSIDTYLSLALVSANIEIVEQCNNAFECYNYCYKFEFNVHRMILDDRSSFYIVAVFFSLKLHSHSLHQSAHNAERSDIVIVYYRTHKSAFSTENLFDESIRWQS